MLNKLNWRSNTKEIESLGLLAHRFIMCIMLMRQFSKKQNRKTFDGQPELLVHVLVRKVIIFLLYPSK